MPSEVHSSAIEISYVNMSTRHLLNLCKSVRGVCQTRHWVSDQLVTIHRYPCVISQQRRVVLDYV